MENHTYSFLIADDTPVMRELVKIALESTGLDNLEFYEAENGQTALELAKTYQPDVIVTDYNMPVMNGLELISKVRQDDDLDAIPIVLLTSEDSNEMVKTFNRNPDFFYMSKPFLPKKLKYLLVERLYETFFG